MAGFSSVMTGLSLVSNLVGGLSSYNDGRRQQEDAYRAMQARQQADYAYAVQQAGNQRAEIAAAAEKENLAKRTALKRAVAKQRAEFGAAGITPSTSGSAEAVLLGLFQEDEAEKAARDAIDNLRYKAIDDQLAQKSRVNVLELSEAREKKKIGQTTGVINTIGSTIGNTVKILG